MAEKGIDKDVIIDRLDHIQASLNRLKEMESLTPGKFTMEDNFAVAEHYLRYALEATFDICAHILSRTPGARVGEYKIMAREMGDQGFLPKDFAYGQLEKMAGYRNRLIHFYFEVTPKEMHGIVKDDLSDFEIFMKHIKKLVE